MFAAARLGAIFVPLNFRLHTEELIYMVKHSDAEAFILGEPFVQMVKDMRKDIPRVKKYIFP